MILGLFALAFGQAGAAWGQEPSISIMTYNVENLFDNKKDFGKDDETYLPLAEKKRTKVIRNCASMRNGFYRSECEKLDWNDETLARKLDAVAKVIGSYNDGRGADIVLLQEVENENVLKMLREKLPKSDYKSLILIEGEDNRGIDVAILSRFEQGEPAKLHPIDLSRAGSGKTRGILQANLKLPNGSQAAVLSVHFPSQANPREERILAFETLNKVASEAMTKFDVVVAGGDFNVSASEEGELFRGMAAGKWDISHHIGCHTCLGSHYYGKDRSWSFLDAIMLARKEPGNSAGIQWKIDRESVQIWNQVPGQIDDERRPRRFNAGDETQGFTDHLPVVLHVIGTKAMAANVAPVPEQSPGKATGKSLK
jgi:hypothetical protein